MYCSLAPYGVCLVSKDATFSKCSGRSLINALETVPAVTRMTRTSPNRLMAWTWLFTEWYLARAGSFSSSCTETQNKHHKRSQGWWISHLERKPYTNWRALERIYIGCNCFHLLLECNLDLYVCGFDREMKNDAIPCYIKSQLNHIHK